jgi:hypothetical protein
MIMLWVVSGAFRWQFHQTMLANYAWRNIWPASRVSRVFCFSGGLQSGMLGAQA